MERKWHPTPALLPGKSHGRRSLIGYSPWGRKELDTTERLHFHFSLSCIGEGNGNPLQCSCLENPRDGGAWWAAVYGVAQSWTWLKRLSSSSSSQISSMQLQLCLRNIKPVKPPARLILFRTVPFVVVVISVPQAEFHSLVTGPPLHFRMKISSKGVSSSSRIFPNM